MTYISKRAYIPQLGYYVNNRFWINSVSPSKSQNQKSKPSKYYYHGIEIPEEDFD
jgi:hypothetical protein